MCFGWFKKKKQKIQDNTQEQRKKDEQERNKQLAEKIAARRKERTFEYKGQKFEVDICDGLGYDVNDDCYEGEKELIASFAKQKDAIIAEAVRGAFDEQFENAKEWMQNPNLTEAEFKANLLANPFQVFISAIDVYEVWFNPANGMIPDPDCSYFGCRIEKGVFVATDFGM